MRAVRRGMSTEHGTVRYGTARNGTARERSVGLIQLPAHLLVVTGAVASIRVLADRALLRSSGRRVGSVRLVPGRPGGAASTPPRPVLCNYVHICTVRQLPAGQP